MSNEMEIGTPCKAAGGLYNGWYIGHGLVYLPFGHCHSEIHPVGTEREGSTVGTMGEDVKAGFNAAKATVEAMAAKEKETYTAATEDEISTIAEYVRRAFTIYYSGEGTRQYFEARRKIHLASAMGGQNSYTQAIIDLINHAVAGRKIEDIDPETDKPRLKKYHVKCGTSHIVEATSMEAALAAQKSKEAAPEDFWWDVTEATNG